VCLDHMERSVGTIERGCVWTIWSGVLGQHKVRLDHMERSVGTIEKGCVWTIWSGVLGP
jgi:hypothetical protein